MRILIIGYGSIGKRHEYICKHVIPESQIILLTRNRFCVSRYAWRVTDSLDQALSFKPDCAIIASPSSFHVEHALAVIKSGCDCFIEKPVADSIEEAVRLKPEVLKTGRIIQIGYNLRYDSCLNKAKEIVDKNLYGALLSVRCEFGQYLPDWRPGVDYRKSVSAQKCLGGGILLEMSHEIDYLSWIVGPVRWVSAWIDKIGYLDIDVEDTALLRLGILREDKEVVATLSMDFIRRDQVRRCDFICEGGTIRWDGVRSTLSLESSESKILYCNKNDRNQTYISQFRDFIACMSSRRVFKNDLASGLRTLRIIESARLSSEGSGVKLFVR